MKNLKYNSKEYQDISIRLGLIEGFPVYHTITAEEQQDYVESGYGSVSELIETEISSYRDWQSDC
jgi:hypothetical protein